MYVSTLLIGEESKHFIPSTARVVSGPQTYLRPAPVLSLLRLLISTSASQFRCDWLNGTDFTAWSSAPLGLG